MFELTKQFRFESAHTLEREYQREASMRVHGHSYRAEVTVAGSAKADSGMLVDLTVLENALARQHEALDHRLLNDIPGLEVPTLENLCLWIWRHLVDEFPNLLSVAVFRDSNAERCVYRGPTA